MSLPSSVGAIGVRAFSGQPSPSSGKSFWSELTSGDSIRVIAALQDLSFVQLFTADPANPNNPESDACIGIEEHGFGDFNNDGQITSLSYAGHLVNPTSVATRYQDNRGASLLADSNAVGTLADGTPICSYMLKDAPDIPFPSDPYYASPTELAAIKSALAAYYCVGQSVTLTAPTIAGYPTPTTQTKTLATGTNTVTFVYQPTSTSTITIDFGKKENAAPTGIASLLSPLVASAVFGTDTTQPCSSITNAQLLPGNSFTAPNNAPRPQTTLGGLNFTLGCTTPGGTATVTLKLNGTMDSLAKLHVYKKNPTTNAIADITNQVTLTQTNGSIHIAYKLTDGQTHDDDNQVNSQIIDPVYLTADQDAVLASTGVNALAIDITAVSAVIVGAALLATKLRQQA